MVKIAEERNQSVVENINSFSVPASQGLLLKYRIKPGDIVAQTLHIKLAVRNIPTIRKFILYQGTLKPYNLHCCDQQGRELAYQLLSDEIQIITNGLTAFDLHYDIRIGQLAKHGHQGRLNVDFLTCSGENILLLPVSLASSATDEEVRNSTAAITLFFDVPKEWISILPFGTSSLSLQSRWVRLTNPSWSDIYGMLKSCFTLGLFKMNIAPEKKGLKIFTPKTASDLLTSQTYGGIHCLYEYYAGLFGGRPQLALVLFELDDWDGNYILGGSGNQTIGATFKPESCRDWELLAHRFFHAFFDSQVTSSRFHQIPQLWFYEGLATYYENVALDALPRGLKVQLKLDVQSNFAHLFQRYLYFRLKEPQWLAFAPMDEAQICSRGMIEFLHYTQAPLLVKLLEDISVSQGNQANGLLRYILTSHARYLTVQQIIRGGGRGKVMRKMQAYLYSAAILPLWYLKPTETQDDSQICQQLNDYRHTLWSWFRLDGIDYQPEHVSLRSVNEGVTEFGSPMIEHEVQQFSPFIHKLLNGNSMFLHVKEGGG